ncbi:MAG: hypothetical protein JWM33_3617 [Caulobacteraceae bacterium]|nr:hypothetical protein [Caulobacteraceae bacterium]
MTSQKAYDTPTKVTKVDGEVSLDGPDGIGLSMTPHAARETGERLVRAADQAEAAKRTPRPDRPD